MKQIFILKGLNCPNCAEKIRAEVATLHAVQQAEMNLMGQRLTLETSENVGSLLMPLREIVSRHEPDVEVSPTGAPEESEEAEKMPILLLVSIVLLLAGLLLPLPAPGNAILSAVAFFAAGYSVLWAALRGLLRGRAMDESFLMSVASLGALAVGKIGEAAAVMVLYQLGEWLSDLAVGRARRSLRGLTALRPDTAALLDASGAVRQVQPEEVPVGSQIRVGVGERIPIDGVVAKGESALDQAALTGEAGAVPVSVGSEVLSGAVNLLGVLELTTTRAYADSAVARIVEVTEEASARKAGAERFITHFARIYTPIVVGLALLLAVVPSLISGNPAVWVYRALTFLVVSCPCALVISVPLTYFSAMGAASKLGALVKGGGALEALASCDTFAFDKTGTLTTGDFTVTQICPETGSADELLRLCAIAETGAAHPLARAVRRAAPAFLPEPARMTEFAGRGVEALIDGRIIRCGTPAFLAAGGCTVPARQDASVLYLSADGIYLGCIVLEDTLRAEAPAVLRALTANGICETQLLTGDHAAAGKRIGAAAGVDAVQAELLPADKASAVEALEKAGKRVAFLGDGLNDAPVLAAATAGIAMGGSGADLAVETADIVLLRDGLSPLPGLYRLACQTRRIERENIIGAIGIKVLVLLLASLGLVGMWLAVFADVGVSLLAVANALRTRNSG